MAYDVNHLRLVLLSSAWPRVCSDWGCGASFRMRTGCNSVVIVWPRQYVPESICLRRGCRLRGRDINCERQATSKEGAALRSSVKGSAAPPTSYCVNKIAPPLPNVDQLHDCRPPSHQSAVESAPGTRGELCSAFCRHAVCRRASGR